MRNIPFTGVLLAAIASIPVLALDSFALDEPHSDATPLGSGGSVESRIFPEGADPPWRLGNRFDAPPRRSWVERDQLARDAASAGPLQPASPRALTAMFPGPSQSSIAIASADSLVELLVQRLEFDVYDRYLQELSGFVPVVILGEDYRIETRDALSSQARYSWLYAYERLEALGVDVRFQRFYYQGKGLNNVIARFPGEVTPEKVVILGAHIDSRSDGPSHLAPGAEDNASGSAGVLAVAEALVGCRFESTLELVLFEAEELGQLGSIAYVAELEPENVVGALVLDMIAYYDEDNAILVEGERDWAPLMQEFVDAADSYTGLPCRLSYESFGSDHVPFQDARIPGVLAVNVDWREYEPYHSSYDTYDRLIPETGAEITRAALATIGRLAGPIEVPRVPTEALPTGALISAIPNPARLGTTLQLGGPEAQPGSIERVRIFDVLGRQVRSVRFRSDDSALGPSWYWDLTTDVGLPVVAGSYWVEWGGRKARISVLR